MSTSSNIIPRILEAVIRLDRVDEDRVRSVATRLMGKKYFKNTQLSKKQLVFDLQGWYAANLNPTHVSPPCGNCDGISDRREDSCPFCGVTDEPGNFSPETVPNYVQEEIDTMTNADAATTLPADNTTSVPTEAAAQPPKRGRGRPKGSTNGASLANVHDALVQPVEGTTVHDLDTRVSNFKRLQSDVELSTWQLGRELLLIHDGRLWAHRKNEDGSARYKGFNSFISEELNGLTVTWAGQLMSISALFSEQQVKAFGASKLGMIAMLPEDKRPQLMAKVEAGASKKEIGIAVQEIRAALPARGKGKTKKAAQKNKDKAAAAKAAKKAAAAEAQTITIANVLGTKTVKLFCGNDPEKRAKKLPDQPWGELELENDVKMIFRISMSAQQELQIRVETKRQKVTA